MADYEGREPTRQDGYHDSNLKFSKNIDIEQLNNSYHIKDIKHQKALCLSYLLMNHRQEMDGRGDPKLHQQLYPWNEQKNLKLGT